MTRKMKNLANGVSLISPLCPATRRQELDHAADGFTLVPAGQLDAGTGARAFLDRALELERFGSQLLDARVRFDVALVRVLLDDARIGDQRALLAGDGLADPIGSDAEGLERALEDLLLGLEREVGGQGAQELLGAI